MKSKISVIISLCDSEKLIEDFLDRLLTQTTQSVEYIFVLNKESMFTSEMVNRAPFENKIIISLPFIETVYASWNRAITASSGEYLTNMNVDDYHISDSLEAMRMALDKWSDHSLVFGKCPKTNSPISFKQFLSLCEDNKTQKTLSFKEVVTRQAGPHPMWRKKIHEQTGMFDESFEAAGDHEFWIRMQTRGLKIIEMDLPTVLYHHHDQTLSNRKNLGLKETERVFEKYGREWKDK